MKMEGIREALERFVGAWDRQAWMADHGVGTGVTDPDAVAETALKVFDGPWVQGWDCYEGWDGYRHGDDLYLRWWRDAAGQRNGRDLWVLVDTGFFAD